MAGEALAGLRERQRALRSAYGSARYGWPETPSEWASRPQTFADLDPGCRVAVFLAAYSKTHVSGLGQRP